MSERTKSHKKEHSIKQKAAAVVVGGIALVATGLPQKAVETVSGNSEPSVLHYDPTSREAQQDPEAYMAKFQVYHQDNDHPDAGSIGQEFAKANGLSSQEAAVDEITRQAIAFNKEQGNGENNPNIYPGQGFVLGVDE